VSHFFHSLTSALVAYGPLGVLLLAFLDSGGIPVPAGMDALVILVATKTPERAWFTAALAVLGSAVGNVVLFMAARTGRRWTRKEETALAPGGPGRFELWFLEYGMVTIFIPAVVPIIPLPLKVFVISAGIMRTRLSVFLSVILTARIIHYFGLAYLGMQLGENSMGWLKAHMWTLTGIALGFCAVMYVVLRWNRRRRAAISQ
jgi:membrane protein YqaA with SNARE-associated domain